MLLGITEYVLIQRGRGNRPDEAPATIACLIA
jgi:hypothetical protein